MCTAHWASVPADLKAGIRQATTPEAFLRARLACLVYAEAVDNKRGVIDYS